MEIYSSQECGVGEDKTYHSSFNKPMPLSLLKPMIPSNALDEETVSMEQK
eukprot:CAMPEP_0185023656 /NCGR_PEP_ID=MMETSP1103-20130426/6307_1 /TAXON_ID=36769 /ORGANISM="Paraphysomonas bandaiensis, Strain Caron Lab Isolate" /LENGTH=49 /DNA_ID=CAMNT_0027556345 /DNA_START=432 /DNA_END=581 /DNA_ORIENTATION=-